MEAEKKANPGYRAYLADGYNVTRTFVLFFYEVVLELGAAAARSAAATCGRAGIARSATRSCAPASPCSCATSPCTASSAT